MRFALVLFAAVILAQSQPPPPRNREDKKSDTAKQKQQNDTKENQPAKNPSAINPSQATGNDDEARAPSQDDQNQTDVNIKAMPPISIGKDVADYVLVIATVLLVVVGGLQLYFLRRTIVAAEISADAAKSSAETARDTLRLTQRADVLMDGVNISTKPNILPNTVVTLFFKNRGGTRAMNVRPKFRLIVPDSPEVVPPLAIPTVLGAGGVLSLPFPEFKDFMDQPTFVGIQGGTAMLSFSGEISYEDVFGEAHHTKCGGVFDRASCSFSVTQNEAE